MSAVALFTPEETLAKLLAIEPETKQALLKATGWPVPQTEATLQGLIDTHRVSWKHMRQSRYYFTRGSRAEQMLGAAC